MAGKDYSEQAYAISRRFDELANLTDLDWKDEQAQRFDHNHVEPVRNALSEIQLPIEHIVDFVDAKLNEIKNITNG